MADAARASCLARGVAQPEQPIGSAAHDAALYEGGAPDGSQSLQCTEALQHSRENVLCQNKYINYAYFTEQWTTVKVNIIIDILMIRSTNYLNQRDE
jgi:hypothetical protein